MLVIRNTVIVCLLLILALLIRDNITTKIETVYAEVRNLTSEMKYREKRTQLAEHVKVKNRDELIESKKEISKSKSTSCSRA